VSCPVLFAGAKQRLRTEGRACGWGIVADATGAWDGRRDAFHQFAPEDVVDAYGAFDDVAQFYAGFGVRRRPLERLRFAIGVRLVNRRVAQVRAGR
jgi:hypothetical protein